MSSDFRQVTSSSLTRAVQVRRGKGAVVQFALVLLKEGSPLGAQKGHGRLRFMVCGVLASSRKTCTD